MLLALACKGGYKKLAFVGSTFMAYAVISGIIGSIWFVINMFYGTGGFINNYIYEVVIYALTIPVTIVIYILMNRHEVQKITEKAE